WAFRVPRRGEAGQHGRGAQPEELVSDDACAPVGVHDLRLAGRGPRSVDGVPPPQHPLESRDLERRLLAVPDRAPWAGNEALRRPPGALRATRRWPRRYGRVASAWGDGTL